MRPTLLVLLALNLLIGAWLLVYGPVGLLREPGRTGMQVMPESFRVLTDADIARQRAQSERATTDAAAAAPAAIAPAPATIDLPQVDCLLVSGFASEAAARRLRSRLAEEGLGDRISAETDKESQKPVLRLAGVDAGAEEQVHQLLREYPKLALEHCVGASAPR